MRDSLLKLNLFFLGLKFPYSTSTFALGSEFWDRRFRFTLCGLSGYNLFWLDHLVGEPSVRCHVAFGISDLLNFGDHLCTIL